MNNGPQKVSIHYESQNENVDELKDHKIVSMHNKIISYTSHILTSQITSSSSLSTRIGLSLFICYFGWFATFFNFHDFFKQNMSLHK